MNPRSSQDNAEKPIRKQPMKHDEGDAAHGGTTTEEDQPTGIFPQLNSGPKKGKPSPRSGD